MSRIIDILSAIRNGETFDAPAMSRAESILQSIANGTAYTDAPMSRFEELLLAIKNRETVSEAPQSRIEEILVAIANGTLDAYLSGKNLFDAKKAFETNEIQDGYTKYTVYTGRPNAEFFVNANTSQEDRRDGFELKCADYGYTHTFYWLYFSNTTIGSGVVTTDNEGRISFYWDNGKVSGEVSKEHLAKMQLTIGSTETAFTSYAFSELEEALIATADKLKGE